MPRLDEEVVALLRDPAATKAISTVDENGAPHTAFDNSLAVVGDDTLALAMKVETSAANRNMLRSIWFDKPVAVAVKKGRSEYLIKGKPIKCALGGPLFREFLDREKELEGPEGDIQSVWLIAALEVLDESFEALLDRAGPEQVFLNSHLDIFRRDDGDLE